MTISNSHKNIIENYNNINEKINIIKNKYSINKESKTTLVVVSKNQPIDKIIPLLDLGHVDFGENRIDEMKEKWTILKQKYKNIRLHFIGNIQSRRLIEIYNLSEYIHSVDRLKIINNIKKIDADNKDNKKIFLQINIANEIQKNGFSEKELVENIDYIKQTLSNKLHGLMCMTPIDVPSTPYFFKLSEIAKKYNIPNLSMGMSNDFQEAIFANSNYLRVGSNIFN